MSEIRLKPSSEEVVCSRFDVPHLNMILEPKYSRRSLNRPLSWGRKLLIFRTISKYSWDYWSFRLHINRYKNIHTSSRNNNKRNDSLKIVDRFESVKETFPGSEKESGQWHTKIPISSDDPTKCETENSISMQSTCLFYHCKNVFQNLVFKNWW